MAVNRVTPLRWRLDRMPAPAWLAIALAAVFALVAVIVSPLAAILTLMAGGALYWAAREARRFVIAPRGEEAEGGDLADLSPLLEALPDPALLVDADRRLAG